MAYELRAPLMPNAIPSVLTIGHSNHDWGRFLTLLQGAGATAVADVRSSPHSRFTLQFNQHELSDRLAEEGVKYVYLGDLLGGRPRAPSLYRNGVADYELMAGEPSFQQGLDRVVNGAQAYVVALLCSEAEPLDCHRCLLVARRLVERGLSVGHVLADGHVESHEETEARLLCTEGLDHEDMFASRTERLARAYASRSAKAAYAETNNQPVAAAE